MKQKKTHDEQEVSDLLKQLQKSFAEPEKAEKPKRKKAEDVDDLKFQEKLAAMLGSLTQPASKKSRSRKTARTIEKDPIIEKPIVEEPIVEEAIVEETIVEEAIVEETIVEETVVEEAPTPAPEKARAKRKPSVKRASKPQNAKPTPAVDVEPIVKEAHEEVVEDAEPIVKEDVQTNIEDAVSKEDASESVMEEEQTSPVEPDAKTADTPIAHSEPPHPLELIVPLSPISEDGERIAIESPDRIEETDLIAEPEPSPAFADTDETPSAQVENTDPTASDVIAKPAPVPQRKPASKLRDKPEGNATSHTITIAKPQVKPVDQAPTPPKKTVGTRPDAPVVIKPKAPPSASATPTAAASDSDTIVIRPRAQDTKVAEPIVIHPPTVKKVIPTPTLQKAEVEAAPIKIGKESKERIAPTPPRDPQKLSKPIMNNEPNTTFVPSTDFAKTTTDTPKTAPTKKSGQKPARPAVTKKGAIADQPTTAEKKPLVAAKKTPVASAAEPSKAGAKPSDATAKKSGRAAKKKSAKKPLEESQLSAMDLVRQRCGLSEDDVSMIFELGYENELGRLVGYENLRQLKNEHLRRIGQTEHKHYRTAYGYRGEEYASTSQSDAVTAAYLHDRKPLLVRVVFTALFSLILLFLELPSINDMVAQAAYMPFVFKLASLLLLGGCAALASRQIAAGLHSFFKFTPTPYSAPALLVPVSLAYGLVTLFIEQELFRVGFLTALVLLVMGICDLLRFSTEMRALKIVSVNEPKIALAAAQPRKKKLRMGDKTVKIINDDIGENRYQVRTTCHTVGHFRRFNNMRSATAPFAVFIVTAFTLATVAAFVCAIATSNVAFALSDFMTVLLLCTPVSAIISYFYPMYLANRLLATRSCALIGDEAVTEYEGSKTVIFRDTDLYTAQRSTEIAVRSGDAFRRDMTLAGALFRKLGGTLGQMAQALPLPEDGDPTVSVTRIHENGVEAIVDNRYQLLLGHAAFLTRAGVKIPKQTTDSILRRASNVGLVYLAIDGSLRLSYEVEYQSQKSFERLIRHLAEAGCVAAICSYDPNLDEVFLQKSRPNAYAAAMILKPGRFEEDKPAEFTDTGAVAQKSALDIAYPLYAASGIAKVRQFAWRMQVISSLLGTLLVTLITLLGNGVTLSLLAVIGIQLFWVVVSCLATHSELNGDKLHFRKHENKH